MSYQFQKLTGVEEISKSDFSEAKVLITNENKTVLKQVPVSDVGTVVEALENPSASATDIKGIKIDSTEYKLSNVEALSDIPEVETELKALKINDTSYKISNVEASTEAPTTENKLKGLNVNGVDYKIASGLPETATAGDAMIYDGSDWTKQDGYGYVEEGTGTFVTWDGNITGRDQITVEDSTLKASRTYYVKISDLTPTANDLMNGLAIPSALLNQSSNGSNSGPSKIVYNTSVANYISSMGGTITSGDGTKLYIFTDSSNESEATVFIFVAYEAQTISFTVSGQEESFVIPSTGIYVKYNDSSSTFTQSLQYGNQITWDGDTEGKSSVSFGNITAYKVSDNYVEDKDKISNCYATYYYEDTENETTSLISSSYIYTLTTLLSSVSATDITGDPDKVIIISDSDNFIHGFISSVEQEITFKIDSTTYTLNGEVGTYLRKVASSTNWSSNVGYESNLNYIVPEIIHKIDSKYTFPKTTTAGTAAVYNGSEWSAQTGYGYTEPSNEVSLTWDGSTTNRTKVTIGNKSYYKVSDDYVTDATQITNFSASDDDGTLSGIVIENMKDSLSEVEVTNITGNLEKIIHIYNKSTSIAIISSEAQTITYTDDESEIYSFTIEAGTYLCKDEYYYITNIAYTNLGNINKINDKYISKEMPFASTKGEALIYNGTNWQAQTGYGYQETIALTWEGDTTNRDSIIVAGMGSLYKVATNTPSASELTNAQIASAYNNIYDITSTCTVKEFIESQSGTWVSGDGDKLLLVLKDTNVCAAIATQVQTMSATINGTTITITVSSTGTYLGYVDTDSYWRQLAYTTTTAIDSKYIPVSVSSTGTATDEVNYITIGGVEKKLATGASYTAGTNIQISDNNVISATDTTYSATYPLAVNMNSFYLRYSDGLKVESGELKADTSYVQPKLTAGTNVQISDANVISATDTTYSEATTSTAGLMSTSDKSKLDGITANATSVSVSSTGTATDEISYITINGTEKKIGGGNGLPAATTAGTAAIYNGTSWQAETGYGYTEKGTTIDAQQTIDGFSSRSSDPTVYYTSLYDPMEGYKGLSNLLQTYLSSSYVGTKLNITINSTTYEVTVCRYYVEDAESDAYYIGSNYYDGETWDNTLPFEIRKHSDWENYSAYINTNVISASTSYTFTVTTPSTTQQIDSKFIPVSVSSTGTATDEISYITIGGVEKKIASGGGSGSTLYRHNIEIYDNDTYYGRLYTTLITSQSTAYTMDTFASYINGKGTFSASGHTGDGPGYYSMITNVYYYNGNIIASSFYHNSDGNLDISDDDTINQWENFSDNVSSL